MADIYERFHSYDFVADSQFQDGLSQLKLEGSETSGDKLLNMKVFYFSKYHAPVTVDGYKAWLLSQEKEEKVESGLNVGTNECQDQIKTEQFKEAIPTDEGNSLDHKATENNIGLSDIMKMIAEQKPIPGVKELNIEPTNTEPTVSNVDRVSKPWEVAKFVDNQQPIN